MAKSGSRKTGRLIVFFVLYGLALTAFLLYLMFPSGAVGRYITYSMERAFPGTSGHVERVYPFLGPGIVLEGLSLGIKGGSWDAPVLDRVWIRPEIWPFLKGEWSLHVEARGLGGFVRGKVFGTKGTRGFTGEFEISDLRLEAVKALGRTTGRAVSGGLSGTVRISTDGSIMSSIARARLRVKDAQVQLLQAVLGITDLSFSEIVLNAEMEKGRLAIGQAEFKGRQFGGSLGGSVSMALPLAESGLDLKGTIEPHPGLFSGPELSSEAKAVIMQLARKGKIGFTLRGTVGSPAVRFL